MSVQQIKHFNYSEKEVTSIVVDEAGSKTIWISFSKNSDNICTIYNTSANNPYQKFYDLDHSVEAITSMKIGGNYLYVAIDDTTNIGYIYTKSTPDSAFASITIPSGINEAPIDMIVTSSDLWFLTSGTSSGDKAKLIKMSLSGTFIETIELNVTGKVIIDAISLTEDSATGDLYIGTNTSPSNLVRVYQTTGGSYTYDVTSLS